MEPAWLEIFLDRVRSKTFLGLLTQGWDRRVAIVIEDLESQYILTFDGQEVICGHLACHQQVDVTMQGTESDFDLLFSGEVLSYIHAKQRIKTKGAFRDQLKLESLIRLAVEPSTVTVDKQMGDELLAIR